LYGGKYPFVQKGDVKAAEFYLREHSQTYNEKGLAQSKLWEPGTLCIKYSGYGDSKNPDVFS
jgi:type I restriction enzyme S subunit